MFTDKELDELDNRFEMAMDDKFDAYNETINALRARISRLERTFQHFHVYNEESGDSCAKCGLDLRDQIHLRADSRQEPLKVK